ncbi:MAG TPA: class I SAM-dependent methyltransferase [Pyrinomonadaceae bacterium]|nr:class I SAM-dependent methyltransferase [Pyrinomonadaceae bacterium]
MNKVETLLVNNSIRSLFQRTKEAGIFEKFGDKVSGQRVLEIGCGRGVGTEIIFDRFKAGEVHAFDLDPGMVGRARKRLSRFLPDRLTLYVGDAEKIDAEDETYDAVFDFGIIHHVPTWRNAVKEVERVLKPGGKFYFEEVTKKALDRWSYRTFFRHPTHDRFTGEEFIREIEANGIKVGREFTYWLFNDLVIGVGRKGNIR